MPFRRARTIDELHDLVADHDLVLTADAPLALALNRRVGGPRLGSIAATPRNYAKQGLEVADRRDLFHRIVRETDLSFKEAATRLDEALSCWEHTGRRDAVLDWREGDPGLDTVLDVLATEESAHSLRDAVQIPESVDLAVVGLEAFSALDRAVLPSDPDAYEVVSPFEPGEHFQPPPMNLLPSTGEIVRTLEAHLTPETADDVGIVLDPTGPTRPLVEAMLDARSIAYHTEEALADHPDLRSLLRLLRAGLTHRRLRGRDVRGLLFDLDLPASLKHDQRLVTHLDDHGARRLRRFWRETRSGTLGEAVSTFERMRHTSMSDLRELLEELGVLDAPVEHDILNALDFYLETYRVEHDYNRRGVLLASGRDNAYVDRPLVFHLGLGTDWAAPPPSYPWIDETARERHEDADLARFERLLQSGRHHVYLVQDARRGKPVTPCFHLHELLDEDFERFTDLDSHRRRAPDPRPATGADGNAPAPLDPGFDPALPDGVEPDRTHPSTLSASSLDVLSYCPRDWYMDQLVPEADAEPLEQGRLFHEFARVYASNPDQIDLDDADTLEALVSLVLGELAGLVDPDEHPHRATDVRVGLQAIAAWIDAHPPQGAIVDGYGDPPPERRDEVNRFADHLDLEVDTSTTERWFSEPAVGVHGKVDLVHGPAHLVDWKSTRSPDTITATVRKARVTSDDAPHRLQPSVYLLHHRYRVPERGLAFTFVDLLGSRETVIRDGFARATEGERGNPSQPPALPVDPDDVERRIPYHPEPFEEHAASRAAFDYICSASQKGRDVFEAVGYDAYRRYVQTHDLPRLDTKQGVDETPFADGLAELAVEKRGAPKTSERTARKAVKKLVEIKKHALFQGDLDALGTHVQHLLGRLDTWLDTRFPVGDDVDMNEVRHRELILRDLDAHRATTPAMEVDDDA